MSAALDKATQTHRQRHEQISVEARRIADERYKEAKRDQLAPPTQTPAGAPAGPNTGR